MATHTNVPSSVQQSKTAVVVSFPVAHPITQLELAALLSLRGRLSQLQAQLDEAEQSIQSRLEVGCSVEGGDHSAKLKTNSRRNVAWKDVVVCLAEKLKMDGAAYCARVLASTKPTKTITLVVE